MGVTEGEEEGERRKHLMRRGLAQGLISGITVIYIGKGRIGGIRYPCEDISCIGVISEGWIEERR